MTTSARTSARSPCESVRTRVSPGVLLLPRRIRTRNGSPSRIRSMHAFENFDYVIHTLFMGIVFCVGLSHATTAVGRVFSPEASLP